MKLKVIFQILILKRPAIVKIGQVHMRPKAMPQVLTLKRFVTVKGPGRMKGFHISYDISSPLKF